MGSIQKLCSRCLLLDNGMVKLDSTPEDCIGYYQKGSEEIQIAKNSAISISDFKIVNKEFLQIDSLMSGQSSSERGSIVSAQRTWVMPTSGTPQGRR